MILLWLIPALLATIGAMLWMRRKPNEFATLERRESALEVLRDFAPRWAPPETKPVPADPGLKFDDVTEL